MKRWTYLIFFGQMKFYSIKTTFLLYHSFRHTNAFLLYSCWWVWGICLHPTFVWALSRRLVPPVVETCIFVALLCWLKTHPISFVQLDLPLAAPNWHPWLAVALLPHYQFPVGSLSPTFIIFWTTAACQSFMLRSNCCGCHCPHGWNMLAQQLAFHPFAHARLTLRVSGNVAIFHKVVFLNDESCWDDLHDFCSSLGIAIFQKSRIASTTNYLMRYLCLRPESNNSVQYCQIGYMFQGHILFGSVISSMLMEYELVSSIIYKMHWLSISIPVFLF